MGERKGVAMRTGIVLAQGGEFGFALLALALTANILEPVAMQILLAALIISMALTPMLIHYNGRLVKYVYGEDYLRQSEHYINEVQTQARDLSDHTIICGYGRIGQNVAHFLKNENLDYLALDLDPERVRHAREAGENVNYGDSTHLEMLQAAGLERAKILIISFNDIFTTLKILPQVRTIRPDIPILVRVRNDTYLECLLEAGATEVIPETLEASVMMATHVLFLVGVPVDNIVKQIQAVHDDRFRMLHEVFHGQDNLKPLNVLMAFKKRLHTVTLDNTSPALNQTLREIKLGAIEVTVKAVRRGRIRGKNPDPDLCLQAGDTLVLHGTPENLKTALKLLATG